MASTGNLALTAGLEDNPWSMSVTMTCQTTGTGGTLLITGQALVAGGGLATALATPGTGVGTYNLDQDLDLQLTVDWVTAEAANVVKLQSFMVEDLALPIDI